jgi:ammonium transporter, Amt family
VPRRPRRGGRSDGRGPAAVAASQAETVFVFNTLLFVISGVLVFWMAAGFAMLEAGFVRSKNVTMQLTKNIGLFSIAALLYYLIGFNLMYPGDGWIDRGLAGRLSRRRCWRPWA